MLKIRQKQILVSSYSLFQKTENLVKSNKKIEKIIEKHSNYRDSIYQSLTDFLFCEIFSQWKNKCTDYYYNIGPKMIDDPEITRKQINAFDTILSEFVLESLLTTDFEKHTWDEFKVTINDLLFSQSSD